MSRPYFEWVLLAQRWDKVYQEQIARKKQVDRNDRFELSNDDSERGHCILGSESGVYPPLG